MSEGVHMNVGAEVPTRPAIVTIARSFLPTPKALKQTAAVAEVHDDVVH